MARREPYNADEQRMLDDWRKHHEDQTDVLLYAIDYLTKNSFFTKHGDKQNRIINIIRDDLARRSAR